MVVIDPKGALYPVMHVILSRWSPIEERSKLAGITYSGNPSCYSLQSEINSGYEHIDFNDIKYSICLYRTLSLMLSFNMFV